MHVILATARTHPELTPSDALLRDELLVCGGRVTVEPWDSIPTGPLSGRLVCLRSTWDYHHRRKEFQRWVAGWTDQPSALWNPPATVLWNLDKIYLRELATAGIRLPLTRWFEPGQRPDVAGFFSKAKLTEAIVKPRVSAAAFGLRRITREEDLAENDVEKLLAAGSILQAFVPEVVTGGELSLIFIRGQFSHAVRKRPAAGDFRVQSEFGGTVVPETVSEGIRKFGEAVVACVPHAWLYARVDAVETASGPLLMELELIEPDLFLDKAHGAAARFAKALAHCAMQT